MITNELLTKFLHEELRFNSETYCLDFKIFNNVIDIKLYNKQTKTGFIGEVVLVERYQAWIEKKRDSKINQILV